MIKVRTELLLVLFYLIIFSQKDLSFSCLGLWSSEAKLKIYVSVIFTERLMVAKQSRSFYNATL